MSALKNKERPMLFKCGKRAKRDENESSGFSPKNVSIPLEDNSKFGVREKNHLTGRQRNTVGEEKKQGQENVALCLIFLSFLIGALWIFKYQY